jgi:hypothetical protein
MNATKKENDKGKPETRRLGYRNIHVTKLNTASTMKLRVPLSICFGLTGALKRTAGTRETKGEPDYHRDLLAIIQYTSAAQDSCGF